MTNNWTDIGNSSLVLVWGANPTENHPACMAHVNRARANGAKLVVVDPRKTRTALQADKYIRQRPGTDIALINGLVRGIIAKMEDVTDASVTATQRAEFYAFLNQTGNGTFYTDGDATHASVEKTGLVPGNSKYTDARFVINATGSDYVRETVVATTGLPVVGGETADTVISNFPKKAASVTADPNTVYNRLKAHVAPYTPSVVANICGVPEGDIAYLVDAFIANSRCSTVGGALAIQDPKVAGYKAVTMLYAMGITQHTTGSQNVKSFAVIQTLMGNMGRAGGGINALRGIHNVQGSTDQGLLFGNIPYYSGNPANMTSADANAFGEYMDNLWGLPLSGTGTRATMDGSYDDAYNNGAYGLQQRGFINMTYNFFGDPTWKTATADRALTNGLYDLWPKGNGDDHITMFRAAGAGTTKAMVVWGQNPAVTEPNQGKIRDGLYTLDTLVVVDMFCTETAMASRKADGVTYLIPAASHVEEAGSVTNSGRLLQWRERATLPKGKSRSDLELLFRLAHALDGAGAFSHLVAQWAALGKGTLNAYQVLYGNRYSWTPAANTNDFETANSGTADIWRGTADAPSVGTVYGSEWMAEQMYREMCPPGASGTSWLYTAAYSTDRTTFKHTGMADWRVNNRAKSREVYDPNGTLAYPGWGFSWLVNRRVFYNNADIPGDVGDFYMGPDSVARLFVSTRAGNLNYSRWYRTIHMLNDKPDTCLAGNVAPHVLPGRFPAHTEPYETPREDLATTWGRNTKGTLKYDCIKGDSNMAAPGRSHSAAAYPFVLTTIRCVEHFQGGPITRNNPWNVEMEPEPWIELNSVDALKLGIRDGDMVNVTTARGDSLGSALTITAGVLAADANWSKGYRARVGVGAQSNQRVAPGVVAIPWHWGDRGLSTGSRANDLCIDAGDANTIIPESKACLCNIVKL